MTIRLGKMNVYPMINLKDNNFYGEDIHFIFEKLCNNNNWLLDNFTCGNRQIDLDVRKLLNDPKTVTNLVINANNNDVVCVYSLSCSGYVVTLQNKNYIYPAVEIKYFVIDKKYQNIPFYRFDDNDDDCISHKIFCKVIATINNITDQYCGADKIILYSTDVGVKFYARSGFVDFKSYMMRNDDSYLDGCTPMFYDL